MQIIWIPSSTSSLKKISITYRSLLKTFALFCTALILLGVGIHFLGFRLAINIKPEIVREMGGVMTSDEKQAIEKAYESRLSALQQKFNEINNNVIQLKTLKDRYAELATPTPVKNVLKEAKGGPFNPLMFDSNPNQPLLKQIDQTIEKSQSLELGLTHLEEEWKRQYQWLVKLPTGSPIANRLGLSSNFGSRIDPIRKVMAQHPGVDFSAPPGTPILASGDGTVLRAETDPAYGQFIEIKHADGFVSKYAHARKLFVQPGEAVNRGQKIAEVGATGRATGPHLHYEIYKNKDLFNPMQFLNSSAFSSIQQVN